MMVLTIPAMTTKTAALVRSCSRATRDATVVVFCPRLYRHVQAHMFSLPEHLKILNAIIAANPGDVMYHFIAFKLTPKMLFHDHAVFKFPRSIGKTDLDVAMMNAPSRFAPKWVPRSARIRHFGRTGSRAVTPAGADSPRGTKKRAPTMRARQLDFGRLLSHRNQSFLCHAPGCHKQRRGFSLPLFYHRNRIRTLKLAVQP